MAIKIDTQGKKCENCKYWKREGATLVGECKLVVTYLSDDVRYRIYHEKVNGLLLSSSGVYTGQDFFCLLHNVELKK